MTEGDRDRARHPDDTARPWSQSCSQGAGLATLAGWHHGRGATPFPSPGARRTRGYGHPRVPHRIVEGSVRTGRPRKPLHEEITVPIATPEVYADMLDRAKNGSFAYPAINITSSQTVTAAIRGFAEAGSDGIIQVSTGGGGVRVRVHGQEHGDRRPGARGLRRGGREEVPRQHRPAHRPLPARTSSTASCARSSRRRPSGSRPAGCRSSRATCGTARRCPSRRTSRSPRSCSP